jgi:hypothetical protein
VILFCDASEVDEPVDSGVVFGVLDCEEEPQAVNTILRMTIKVRKNNERDFLNIDPPAGFLPLNH